MKYFLILIFYISSLLADDEIIPSLKFPNMFNTGNKFQAPNSCSIDNFQNFSSQVSELHLKCAIDLCGQPKDLKSGALLDFNFDQYVQDKAMSRFSEIESEIKDMIDFEFIKNTNFLSALGDKFEKEGELKPDYSKWEDRDYDTYTWSFFDKYVALNTDRTKLFSERLTYTLLFPKDATDTFKKGIKEYAEYKKNEIQTNFSQGVVNDFYTIEEAIKILKEKFDKFEKQYLGEKKSKPDFMKDKIEDYKEIKEQIDKGEFENTYSIYKIVNDLNILNNELVFQQTGKSPNDIITYACSGDACKKAIQEKLNKQDFKKLYTEIKNKNNEKEKRTKERITYCKSEFAMKAIKDYEKESFKKLIPEIKENFLKNVFKDYSSESKQKFNEYLNNDLNFSFEINKPNLQEYIDKFKDNYKDFKEKTTLDDYKNYSTEQFMRELLRYQNYIGKMDPLIKMSVCEDSLSYVSWDEFVSKEISLTLDAVEEDFDPEKDNITISMFSCTHHSHGKGNLTHEMGHALSFAFSKGRLSNESYGKFKELRQCANTLYKVNANENNLFIHEHDGDLFRTEEDTADLISYIANPDKSVLFNCAILEPTLDGEAYNDLELFNRIEIDTHSAPLLRVLQEAIHKKVKIPTSCQELINQNKGNFRFTPCF